MIKTVQVLITGKVQGVCFRAYTLEKAIELNLNGWVRNNPDGTVEAIFQGQDQEIQQMLDWCKQGPSLAIVDDLKVEDISNKLLTKRFEDFYIQY
ncbi:MAG: acylphosphatase [Candidatus Margulisiibacteriota bacterium]|jgi:acylphosphatase